MLADEWTGVYTIPVHKNAIEVAQLVRDFLKSSVTPTSIFRSVAHDKKQGRTGNSQHNKAFAIDLKGEEISKRLRVAIETKNTFYEQLRDLGVNGFGLYDSFVHLDFRAAKGNNEIYFWDNVKKKGDEEIKNEHSFISSDLVKYIWIPVLFLLLRKPLLRIFMFKRKYKIFKSKFL